MNGASIRNYILTEYEGIVENQKILALHKLFDYYLKIKLLNYADQETFCYEFPTVYFLITTWKKQIGLSHIHV